MSMFYSKLLPLRIQDCLSIFSTGFWFSRSRLLWKNIKVSIVRLKITCFINVFSRFQDYNNIQKNSGTPSDFWFNLLHLLEPLKLSGSGILHLCMQYRLMKKHFLQNRFFCQVSVNISLFISMSSKDFLHVPLAKTSIQWIFLQLT